MWQITGEGLGFESDIWAKPGKDNWINVRGMRTAFGRNDIPRVSN
jgi:hypothetical protein